MEPSEAALSAQTDEELMARVRTGDHGALGTLFARHQQHVHAMCYRLTGDAAAADDLVQECFLRVLRFGGGFDGRSKFTTWLFRLVHNRCVDHMTATSRKGKHRDIPVDEVVIASPMPVEEDERLELVRRALFLLPADKREVLVLSRYENMKYREIADVCQISVEAVKTRAHRAMRELRRIFHELEREYEM